MFPFLVVDGWSYKGFGLRSDDGAKFLHFRFEKTIRRRLAFARLPLPLQAFTAKDFELKDWFLKNLREQEEAMTNRHLQEFPGAA